MLTSSPARCRRGQWTVIGTLVALAIIVIVAAIYIPRLLKPQTESGAEETAMQEANGTACTMYLSQLNQAASMYAQDHNGRAPSSLDDLKKYGITDDMIHAPDCSFAIDPATGRVTGASSGRPIPGSAPAASPAPAYGGAAQPSSAPPPPPNGGTRGPGGVTIPNIPTAGAAGDGG